MSKKLELFIDGDLQQPVEFICTRIINAGYSGRNQEEVRKHIDELKALGVPAPDSVPVYYPKPGSLLTHDILEVADQDNSGEAEFALLMGDDEIYVAVGSDHTDRNLEVNSTILKAKQMCPNVISRAVWRLSDVEDHWDDLLLTAWLNNNPEEVYQQSKLTALMSPYELIERVKNLVGEDLTGCIIYSGTVATHGEIRFAPRFEVSLEDRVRGKSLLCGYSVQVMNWFKNV